MDAKNGWDFSENFVLPKHHRGSLVKPLLKPGKQGRTHNEFRKLSLMSVLRKHYSYETFLDGWGLPRGGFKQHKRTTGGIFILLATIAATLWPLLDADPECHERGLLLVDVEPFSTLRQERLFHKMQVAGLPDNGIMLWKELAQTHSVQVVSRTTRGESIKTLVGVPQGSGWSPELATLYVDIGLAQHLQEVQSGVIVLLGGTYVHLLMYAACRNSLIPSKAHRSKMDCESLIPKLN